MKILLLGANGQLGRTFLEDGGLAARGDLVAASRDGVLTNGSAGEVVDLSIPATIEALLDRVRPDLIVNTAAYTAVDRAEQESELADRVNGEAVGMLGNWATANSAKVIHYSTDYVFDGNRSQPYTVDEITAPLGAYGRSKLKGEQALRDSRADHLILRTAWVYAAHGQNFLRTMLRLGGERDELRVVADQHGAPTDTSLIVRATLAALGPWMLDWTGALGGTHHLVASGETTWHGFAETIFERAANLGIICRLPKVVPITTAEFPTPAVRPEWSLLDNRGFQQRFDFALPHWQQGLDQVLHQLVSNKY